MDNFPRAGEPDFAPAAPISEISMRAEDGPPTSLSSLISAAAPQASPLMRGISHDLPTPPISEGGDDIESKEALPEEPADLSHKFKDSVQTLKATEEEKPPTVSSSGWSRTG